MHTVTIEILRPGKSFDHNLSAQTEYIALCGSHPPVDFKIDCDQDTFLRYKEKLRYGAAGEEERADAIGFFQQLMAKIFDDISPLRLEGQTNDWLHLRLVMTPKELAQLPFELALTPQGFQGHPLIPFLMNPQRLTILTREVRQVASTRYVWPHKPRILFAWAEPDDEVPHDDHYNAIREVVKHFARPIPDFPEPVPDLAPLLVQLKNASLQSISNTVKAAIDSDNPFTHIHILAHGIEQDNPGNKEFKLVLHDSDDVGKSYHANGNEIAGKILETDHGKTRIPAVVSLMACDSSNTGSISLPAGSLAHQLHESGIPCVFASQFPLSKEGSVKLVSTLYRKLLIEGDDPR
ncbi:MAG: CHAT domain-containing protein, partial [Bacteroidetes bacterium]|nr:CHAT domain-containing protein [Bacteroidota bacterium]